jgi:hypothetical protein
MPDWGWLVGAASVVLTVAGYIGSTWGRQVNLAASRDEWRQRDEGHVADLSEVRQHTAAALEKLAEAREEIAQRDARIAALLVDLTAKQEWTQIVAALAAHDQITKQAHDKLVDLSQENQAEVLHLLQQIVRLLGEAP